MSQDLAFAGTHVGAAVADARADMTPKEIARAPERPHHAPAAIAVEYASGARLSELQSAWLDLIGRADATNVFMNPALVRIAGEAFPAKRCGALLAWQNTGSGKQLAGIWSFAIGRAPQSAIPVSVLTAPPMPHGYLATPVIDRDCLDQVLDAMLTYVAGDASLPNIIALNAMGADGATMQALARVTAARGSTPCIFSQAQRPLLVSKLDAKAYFEKALSSSSRKKLRQHRRRLAEKGNLQFRVLSDTPAVIAAFEDFLTLEAAGWKGRQGSALLSDPADAGFARAMIEALAAQGDASIHMLTLDERAVSMQIVLRAGATVFTWKTAYDEDLHDFSPGSLLLEDYTATFLADASIAMADSCSFDDSGFMAAWSERGSIANLWLDARRGRSLAFTVLSQMQRTYLALRQRGKVIHQKYLRAR